MQPPRHKAGRPESGAAPAAAGFGAARPATPLCAAAWRGGCGPVLFSAPGSPSDRRQRGRSGIESTFP